VKREKQDPKLWKLFFAFFAVAYVLGILQFSFRFWGPHLPFAEASKIALVMGLVLATVGVAWIKYRNMR
jgi:hypothetical protein